MFRILVFVRTKFTVKNTQQLFDINAHTGAISGNHTLMNCNKVESDNIWAYIAISMQKTKCFENPLTFVKVASQAPLPIQFSWAKYAMQVFSLDINIFSKQFPSCNELVGYDLISSCSTLFQFAKVGLPLQALVHNSRT